MKKVFAIDEDKKTKEKCKTFLKKVNSNMKFESDLSSDMMSFEWLDEIEFACKYIDNIIRNPRLALINEENVVKVEKVRKVTVATVKDLTKHTDYIDKIEKETGDVQPSKLLEVRSEETFNTYENRFIYTLVENTVRFMTRKEKELEEFAVKNNKVLEYSASSLTDEEKVDIELKITTSEIPKDGDDNNIEEEIKKVKERISGIKVYVASWYKSEFIKSLIKQHAPLVLPPIRKTNLILKNPNFQFATKLWNYLQAYENDDGGEKEGLNTDGNNTLRGILDNNFLIDYFVLDSVRKTKKEQKAKLSQYAILMINYQIQKAVSLLMDNGIKITDEDIMNMVTEAIKREKTERNSGCIDVKKKFKSAMDEYLERTKDYL